MVKQLLKAMTVSSGVRQRPARILASIPPATCIVTVRRVLAMAQVLASSGRACAHCLPRSLVAAVADTSDTRLAVEALHRMAAQPGVLLQPLADLYRRTAEEMTVERRARRRRRDDSSALLRVPGHHRGRLRLFGDHSLREGDAGLSLTARAHVTPTRVALVPPEPEVTNRVLRRWADQPHRFLRVTFTLAESLKSSSPGGFGDVDAVVYERMRSVMRDGVCVAGRRYDFLAFSTSQLRECSCWMFAGDAELSAADVRRWMGDFHSITNTAKYAARMGQCFSRQVAAAQPRPLARRPPTYCPAASHCALPHIYKKSAPIS